MPGSENVQRLTDAGYFIKTPLPAEYEQVIEGLSSEEVDVLISVKDRLDAAQAHTEPNVPAYAFFIAVPY
jgi:hypothetical protein